MPIPAKPLPMTTTSVWVGKPSVLGTLATVTPHSEPADGPGRAEESNPDQAVCRSRSVGSDAMHYGFVVPFADAREFAELAQLGEQRGWDGVFTWEALWGVDAWVTLGAAAMVTERVKLGTMLTPVSRHKPWDLASKVRTVDTISGGRAILGAGLGACHEGWLAFEADEGRKLRAEKLDEALAIYAGLMAGQPFEFEGTHFQAKPTDFVLPDPPVQKPHPPVWVVGARVVGRTRQPSLERAARWDGLIPQWLDKADSSEGSSSILGPDRMATDRRRCARAADRRRPAVGGLRRRPRGRQHRRVRQDRAPIAPTSGRLPA